MFFLFWTVCCIWHGPHVESSLCHFDHISEYFSCRGSCNDKWKLVQTNKCCPFFQSTYYLGLMAQQLKILCIIFCFQIEKRNNLPEKKIVSELILTCSFIMKKTMGIDYLKIGTTLPIITLNGNVPLFPQREVSRRSLAEHLGRKRIWRNMIGSCSPCSYPDKDWLYLLDNWRRGL